MIGIPRLVASAFLLLVVGLVTVAVVPARGQTDVTAPPECGEYEGGVCQGWFTDDAGVVDDDQRIEDAIGRLVSRYGNQIAMVIVADSRGRAPGQFAAD
ncbi:MAG: TPM domain-containing protein, partial [Actinomycetota bacterium]|nr:TPM domain-containing protein [Actinomycetota bacterium]